MPRVKLHIFVILTAIMISLFAVSFVFAAEQTNAKVQSLRQTGKQLLDVGYEQYRRGMYDSAKTTLNKAATYKDYLSVSDASKLEELLGNLNSQPSQPSSPVVDQNTAEESVAVEQPAAEQQTQTVVVSEPVQIPVQTPVQVEPNVNSQYIEFVPVDTCDVQQIKQNQPPTIPVDVKNEFIAPVPESDVEANVSEDALPQAEPLKPSTPAVEAEKTKEDYIEVVKQKQRIQQSYTKAIVNEAVAKAREYAGKEEFIKAKDEISRATGVVEKNKLLLGDEDYAQYKATLNQLLQEVNTRQTEVETQKAEKAKTQAQASQEKLRSQQTSDRQKRIGDLMTHSAEYQEQQRYQEALAQLDTLLAIDPTNREALRNKQMLEDIINLRRQVDMRKEMGKEEQDILYDTQKSMIPHADLMNYPRNWQDIAAKRKPTTITGLSAADTAVNGQLETLVDLSALTPDTPIEEAIEIVRTSVDPPLKVAVRWKDLADNAYVERDTVIGMQGLNGIPVGKGLKELLDSVSGGIVRIDYAVDDGIITIATTGALPNKLVTHVYDITELIGIQANYRADLATQIDIRTSQNTSTQDPTQDLATRTQNAAAIMQIIQDTIVPTSWLINGGEGTISSHVNRLVISQTPQIHEQIQKLLMEDLRESLGHQISIETRFLFVTENFLEDIGLDMDMQTGQFGKLGPITFAQSSYELTKPSATQVPGTLADAALANSAISTPGRVSYGTPLLDDLSLSFFLRATQAHRDAKMLTAPRITVLSGESASIRVAKEVAYVSDYSFTNTSTANSGGSLIGSIADPTTDTVTGGVVLNVTPTISADKKYVILEITTNYTKATLADFAVHDPQNPTLPYMISLPTLEVSEVQTRVSVPDGGTLLIGGQKLGAEVNKEAGVPGVSKMPVFGRLFSNRSKVKDQDILLILVKPTIIIQKESEKDAFAPLEE